MIWRFYPPQFQNINLMNSELFGYPSSLVTKCTDSLQIAPGEGSNLLTTAHSVFFALLPKFRRSFFASPSFFHENLSKWYKNMHYCDIFASSPMILWKYRVSLTTSVCQRILCDHHLIHSTLHCYHDCHMTVNPKLFAEEEDSQPVRRV